MYLARLQLVIYARGENLSCFFFFKKEEKGYIAILYTTRNYASDFYRTYLEIRESNLVGSLPASE